MFVLFFIASRYLYYIEIIFILILRNQTLFSQKNK